MGNLAPEVCSAAIYPLILAVYLMLHSLDLHYPRLKHEAKNVIQQASARFIRLSIIHFLLDVLVNSRKKDPLF